MMGTSPSIGDLLPHGPRMQMLHELVEVTLDSAHCRLTIRESDPFVFGGKVRAIVAIEYIAQCIAVYYGWHQRRRGRHPKVGYLVAIPKLELHTDAFFIGQTLDVEVHCAYRDPRAGSFSGEIILDGEVVVRGQLSVFEDDAEEADPPLPS